MKQDDTLDLAHKFFSEAALSFARDDLEARFPLAEAGPVADVSRQSGGSLLNIIGSPSQQTRSRTSTLLYYKRMEELGCRPSKRGAIRRKPH